MNGELRHGDAFAGIGGFGIAAREVGWKTVWAAEIDDAARAIYSHRLGHPCLRFDRDIKESRDLPPLDILTGGFPCQDLSIAGKKAGLAGGRSGLFFELARLLEETRPTWFVFENVPGLLSSHGGRDMAAVLSTLVDCGYGIAWRVLDAQFFGLAQRRKRVFLVGHSSGDESRASAILFEPEGLRRDPPSGAKEGEEIAGTLGSLAGGGFRTTDLDQNGAFIVVDRREAPPVSEPISTVEGKRWTAEGCTFRLVNCILDEGAPVDSDRVRETPGLPRSLDVCPQCEDGPDGIRYRGLGNAVAVPVVRWIFNRIATHGGVQ